MRYDLLNKRFGRLVVVAAAPDREFWYGDRKTPRIQHYWCVRCDCGAKLQVRCASLRTNNTQSCGCLQRERTAAAGRLQPGHRMTKHPAYNSWRSMLGRCKYPGTNSFDRYGGRGINVCAKWSDGFDAFWEDMGSSWAPGLTIERKDANGDYTPENCCWVTRKQQGQNKSTTRWVDTPLGHMTFLEAVDQSGVSYETLAARINRRWPAAYLFAPVGTRLKNIQAGAAA